VAALEDASRRGVAVRIVTNSPRSSDNAVTQGVFLEQWPRLLARVPSARLWVIDGDDTLHAKLMAFDRRLALVGSYNLDPSAMFINSELMVGLWSHRLNRTVVDYAEEWIARGAHEYRIRRDADGNVVRNAQGEPLIAFGPVDHLRPEERRDAERVRDMLVPLRTVLRLEPMLSTR
jgi:phosphatidylserine/phosphatidylglycerophosphate/cardiolipin synthase-like enzyme